MIIELSALHKVFRHKIDYKTRIDLQSIVLKKLKVNNLAQLRDRFEGQRFLERFLISEYSKISALKFLEESESKYHLDNLTVIASSIEDYPLVPIKRASNSLMTFVNLMNSEVYIFGVGIIDDNTLLTNIETHSLSPLLEKQYLGYFKNFNSLR